MRCNKNHRDLRMIGNQLPLELDASFSRHPDVE